MICPVLGRGWKAFLATSICVRQHGVMRRAQNLISEVAGVRTSQVQKGTDELTSTNFRSPVSPEPLTSSSGLAVLHLYGQLPLLR